MWWAHPPRKRIVLHCLRYLGIHIQTHHPMSVAERDKAGTKHKSLLDSVISVS